MSTPRFAFRLLVGLSLLLWRSPASRGQGAAPEPLRLNQPLERALERGSSHLYQFTLAAGEYARVEIDQHGADVAALLAHADGEKLAEVNLTGSRGYEFVSVTAAESATYRLEIRALSTTAKSSRYQIKLAAQRAATDRDQQWMTAERLLLEGARLYKDPAQLRQAVEKLQAALPLLRAAGDRYGEGVALRLLGVAHFRKNENQQARAYANQAVALFRELGDQREVAVTLGTVGDVLIALGEAQQALDAANEALRMWQAVGDAYYEGRALYDLGLACSNLRDQPRALAYFEQALPLFRQLGERHLEAGTLGNLGNMYRRQGDLLKAAQYYEQARLLQQAEGDTANLAGTLNNLGIVYKTQGDYPKAIGAYTQALQVWHGMKLRSGEALALINLGNLYNVQERWRDAREVAMQGLSLAEELGESRSILGARQALALAAYGAGQLAEARQQLDQALALTEAMRARILNRSQRASWFAAQHEVYTLYFDVLMAQHAQQPTAGYAAQALQVCESTRARVLLELLTEAGIDLRRDLPPALAEQERALQTRIEAADAAQRKVPAGQPAAEQNGAGNAAARDLALLTAEYEQLQTQIRRSHPQYAELKQTHPLSLTELQQQVLDEKTLLLEYALGQKRSVLFAVTPTALHSFKLPGAAEINAAAKRYYQLLTALGKPPVFRDLVAKEVWRKQLRLDTATAAAALSRMLLEPARDLLGQKRLLIVPDGALHYVPFAALPELGKRDGGLGARQKRPQSLVPNPQPLIARHEIMSLPSASTLAVLRQELKDRPPAAKTLALLADPVFDATDERVQGNVAKDQPSDVKAEAKGELALLRDAWIDFAADAGESSGNAMLTRLPATRLEAQALQKLVPASERLMALDFEANRATALSEALRQYRYVHFATHGLLNSAQPELSGLVLSLVDRQGQPQNGFLRALDVFNLKLPAELVVLSGCRTALGKEINGEGLVGLTRGFMYAGARRVLASTWSVNDAATAELMQRFYSGLLSAKAHTQPLSPAAALRAAQLALWRDKRWQDPYYWAAFVLQGEW
ncbi:MAG: CHAT domain-containing protein [Acidobacteria bacterium]|nr:CHAT domain-containing protein [Acidobacteriota bacterium]MBI3425889.1 CHAT domain-containing protein [Acidobacteriota bacterium]